jgi:hypothetical protein
LSESALYGAILQEFSHGDTRLFRVNAGMAYQGKVVRRTPQTLILSPWYPIKLAVAGMSDIIGWSDGAIFTAIEAKSRTGRVTPEQEAFILTVRKAGGRAGIARTIEEAGQIIHA